MVAMFVPIVHLLPDLVKVSLPVHYPHGVLNTVGPMAKAVMKASTAKIKHPDIRIMQLFKTSLEEALTGVNEGVGE